MLKVTFNLGSKQELQMRWMMGKKFDRVFCFFSYSQWRSLTLHHQQAAALCLMNMAVLCQFWPNKLPLWPETQRTLRLCAWSPSQGEHGHHFFFGVGGLFVFAWPTLIFPPFFQFQWIEQFFCAGFDKHSELSMSNVLAEKLFSFVCLCCHLLGPVKTCWLKIWAMLVIIGKMSSDYFCSWSSKAARKYSASPVCFFSLNSTFYAAFIVLLLMPMKMTVIIIIHRNAPLPIIIWTPWCILVKLCQLLLTSLCLHNYCSSGVCLCWYYFVCFVETS